MAVGAALAVLAVGLALAFWGGRKPDMPSGPLVSVTLLNLTYLHDASVHYYLDGRKLDAKALEGPIQVPVGEHKLEARRGDAAIELRVFRVGPGDDRREVAAPLAEADGEPGPIREIKHANGLSSVAVSPDGRWLLASSCVFSRFNHNGEGNLGLWELDSGKALHDEPLGNADRATFGPTGTFAFVGIRANGAQQLPFVVQQYDLRNPTRWKDSLRFTCKCTEGAITSLDVSRDGGTLLIGTAHEAFSAISLYDTRDGKRVANLDGVSNGCLAADGKRFVDALIEAHERRIRAVRSIRVPPGVRPPQVEPVPPQLLQIRAHAWNVMQVALKDYKATP